MIRNVLAGIGCLTVLAILAVAAWIYRADIERWIQDRRSPEIVMIEPSAELADQVDRKIRAIENGEAPGETRFTESELQSYVQYRIVDRLPAGVSDPAVDLQDSTMAITALLDFTRLQVEGAPVENLRRVMGDSARVAGMVMPLIQRPGEGRIRILSLQAGMFPVPPLLMGNAISSLGFLGDGQDVLLAIPADIVDVHIENEELVLIRGG